MKSMLGGMLLLIVFVSSGLGVALNDYLSPTALAATRNGETLYVACGTASRILCFDTARKSVFDSIAVPASPSGLVLSVDEKKLYVTCAAPKSQICIIDLHKRKIVETIPAGHTAAAPVVSPDGRTLYVCNQFNNDVSVFDLVSRQEVERIPVQREPIAADITRDGKYLLVANHLSNTPSNLKTVAATISVIDLVAGRTVNELNLPVGSEMLKDLRVSPNGKYAVLTHIFCNYDLPTRRVELGLINANALTIIDLSNIAILYTLLLDTPARGAGNPWGVAWSADSSKLVVAHAGTHEASIIDFPALLAGLPDVNRKAAWPTNESTSVLKFVPHYEDEELNDGLPFLVGARQRVSLPSGDYGPRAILVSGHTVYTANYFSDDLSAIDLTAANWHAVSLSLGAKKEMNAVRRGEFYFHDANLCFQGWQSCSSCHPGGGRVDALNWDLASEGPGHPKNTKSMLLADQVQPLTGTKEIARSMGDNLASAVRVAVKTLLFTNVADGVASDMVEYINSLKPVPSPYLLEGELSPAARRGKELFSEANCVNCHVPGLFCDQGVHNVGTVTRYDTSPFFRTPSLIEAWRTAPYLHMGSAATIRDVLTDCNPGDGRHGEVAGLSSQEIDDLCAYVLSL